MLNNQLVRDRFGQHYKIHTSRDKPAPKSLKPELFRSELQASRFINNLIVPIGYWKSIYLTAQIIHKPVLNDYQLIDGLSVHLRQGKINIYKIDTPPNIGHSAAKITVTDKKNNRYTFTSATALLTTPKEVLSFVDKKAAEKYLSEISPDKKSMLNIANELDLPKTQTVNDSGELKNKIATGLVSGEIIVIVDQYTTPPKPEESLNIVETFDDRKADLGPHETSETPKHWFEFSFVNESAEPYSDEPFIVKLSDKSTNKAMTGNSSYTKDQLPAGMCSIKFDNFYGQIETWLKEWSK